MVDTRRGSQTFGCGANGQHQRAGPQPGTLDVLTAHALYKVTALSDVEQLGAEHHSAIEQDNNVRHALWTNRYHMALLYLGSG